MKSSYLTNLVLLLLIIALAWWLFQPEQETGSSARLSKLTVADVSDIQIQRHHQPTIHLQKQQDDWFLIEPFSAPANAMRLKLILSLLTTPVETRFAADEVKSLAPYGLQSPATILQLNDQTFAFGEKEEISQQRYVLHQQNIMLVNDEATPLLNASANQFIENRLIPQQRSFTHLSLPINDETIQIEKQAGRWQSEAPFSSDQLTQLVDSWHHAYATQVRYLSVKDIEALPSAQIQLQLADESVPLSLIMTETDTSLLLTNPASQLQYDFPKAIQHQLMPSPTSE